MFNGKATIASSDRERSVIGMFFEALSGSHPDEFFETDSRPFECGGEKLLFSTDEFSAEDQFRSGDPYSLGWNVVAATLSDILAAGGLPLYFGHAVTIQKDWDDHYIRSFSKGVASCLEASGSDFLGGDVGLSHEWSYTGIAIGKELSALNRRGAEAGDGIFITGSIGAGNLEAALKLYSGKKMMETVLKAVTIRFPLRIPESALVRKYARCCIDTSDGLMRALMDLARINVVGFSLQQIPYVREGVVACNFLGKPRELLFLGECGEYELLFTVPGESEGPLLEEASKAGLSITKIGSVTGKDTFSLADGKKSLDLKGYGIYARNYGDTGEYIDHLVEFIRDGKE